MPGTKPLCAISRRQIRQRPNLRYTERARPQRRQRLYSRVLNFAGRAWRTRWDVLAILGCLLVVRLFGVLDGLLVGLGVLGLELLQGGLLGLGLGVRLVEAGLLLGGGRACSRGL